MMDVYINDQLTMKLVCIPQYLTELTLGRLLTEGIIERLDEVKSLYICEEGRRARVHLAENVDYEPRGFVELTPSCCTDNHILNDYFVSHREVHSVRPIPWEASWIFALADRFAEGMPLHEQTWGTHSCFLARGEKLLFTCEDIGRHNALDKAIGYALRNGIDLSQCIVYSSGRIPTDMAMKAIRAGIPILASKAVPSDEAVALAEEYHLTMICAARRDSMRLYAGKLPKAEISSE
ncbi:MAG: formate dehydrogenase accessory sulfurtransferase FdhD [Acetatifactor sp.]|nr:formate dehydrogenase accessory sulfurtransferase FdhD [Acetatifactor sp.]